MGDIIIEEQKSDEHSSSNADSSNNSKDETLFPQSEKKTDSADIDLEIICKKDVAHDQDLEIKTKNEDIVVEVDGNVNAKPEVEMLLNCTPTSPPTPRRVNKLRDHSSNIFPAGCMGCREDPPSDHIVSPRRFLDHMEAKYSVGHIDNTPRKRPSSAKPNNFIRNPVTGVGLEDEIKKPPGRKKDGNPLLGEGYATKEPTPSSTRIPPGGYSQGLW